MNPTAVILLNSKIYPKWYEYHVIHDALSPRDIGRLSR